MLCQPPSRRSSPRPSRAPLRGRRQWESGKSKPSRSQTSPSKSSLGPHKTPSKTACGATNFGRCDQSNQQYSVTALTDTTGTISERYAYDAYGKVTVLASGGTVLSGSAYGNRYTYTGREWDSQLGLYHYRARMYDPVAGRFVSRDPIELSTETVFYYSSYLYVGCNPSGFLDPSGMKACCKPDWRQQVLQPQREIDSEGNLFFRGKFKNVIRFQTGQNAEGEDCDASCCQYRQYIKGQFSIGGNPLPEALNMCYGRLSSNEYVEDTKLNSDGSCFRYGYRSEANRNDDVYLDNSSGQEVVDRDSGNIYVSTDEPGFRIKRNDLGKTFTIDLKFKGEILDFCNCKVTAGLGGVVAEAPVVESKTWTIKGGPTVVSR